MSKLSSLLCVLPLFSSGCAPEQEAAAESTAQVHSWTSQDDGFHTTSWWLDTGEAVVVFDAQFTPALAQALVQDIQAQTDSPITHLVITHPNPDKFNGAPVFAALGAQVVASQATVDAMAGVHAYKQAYFEGVGMFEVGTYPALAEVDQVFSGSLSLSIPGSSEPVSLQVLSHSGVASTQTVATFERHVFVGDLVSVQTHAWLEGGIVDGQATPDLEAWDLALSELRGLLGEAAILHPGRGPSVPAAAALTEQQAYLRSADETVRAVLGEQADPAAALGGESAGDLYGEMTERLAQAWPEYAHSYLVTYGVYGLAWSVAGE